MPRGQSPLGPPEGRQAAHSTSAFLKKRSTVVRNSQMEGNEIARAKRSGTKDGGVGVSSSAFSRVPWIRRAFVIRPDGRIAIQSGIGNLGTESISDVHRVVAEILGVPWAKV